MGCDMATGRVHGIMPGLEPGGITNRFALWNYTVSNIPIVAKFVAISPNGQNVIASDGTTANCYYAPLSLTSPILNWSKLTLPNLSSDIISFSSYDLAASAMVMSSGYDNMEPTVLYTRDASGLSGWQVIPSTPAIYMGGIVVQGYCVPSSAVSHLGS